VPRLAGRLAAAPAELLTTDNLSIRFRGVRALDSVSISVRTGGITALIGPNGAGKTTFFNCVTGLSQGAGRITFAGENITTLPPQVRAQRGIARTFQTPALVDGMTVLENVVLGAQSAGHRGLVSAIMRPPAARGSLRRAEEYAVELLARFGLTDLASQVIDPLPHGIRRRVEIVRALVGRPRLILLDEPAAGLEPAEALQMCKTLGDCAEREGTTLLLVEHSVALVMEIAHTVLVLDAGRLVASGPAEQVRADPVVIAAYLGEEDAVKSRQ
jgi:branched-chain amino acid transport system ATP-binding protein